MPISTLRSVLHDAFERRYGVPAFNVVDDLTMQAVVNAAVKARSPVIVQTSVKTVRAAGGGVLAALFGAIATDAPVPVVLHLDHCPDREVITECIKHGWNSVLFDGSGLELAECTRQTREVVDQAHASGVDVEGEIEGIKGVEDGIAAQQDGVYSIESAVGFIAATGIDCFAPAIGNAHGMYTSEPALDAERVSQLVALTGIPVALHGGTGLTEAQFRDLTGRGCAKVNISTALKHAFIGGYRGFLADHPSVSEPLQVMTHVRDAVEEMARYHISCLGAADRA